MRTQFRWSSEQDRILFEYGNLGSAFCRDLIADEFGVWRSEEATKRHANRIGASVEKLDVCPVCGRPTRHLVKTSGYCTACHYSYKADTELAYLSRLEGLRKTEADSAELRERRRYDALRQRSTRLRHELGIEGRREEKTVHRELSLNCPRAGK